MSTIPTTENILDRFLRSRAYSVRFWRLRIEIMDLLILSKVGGSFRTTMTEKLWRHEIEKARTVTFEGVIIEFRGDEAFAPAALRALIGTTPTDAQVDSVPLPSGISFLRICLQLVRW